MKWKQTGHLFKQVYYNRYSSHLTSLFSSVSPTQTFEVLFNMSNGAEQKKKEKKYNNLGIWYDWAGNVSGSAVIAGCVWKELQ